MTHHGARSHDVSRNIHAAVKAVLDARGDDPRLRRILEHSDVPMVIADSRRRFVEVNHPARLWFRLSLKEMRTFAIGDLTPAHPHGVMEQAWRRMLDAGSVTGRYPVYASDNSRVEILYHGVAHVLAELHLIAFAPADWPTPEPHAIDDDRPGTSDILTPREIDVLKLAADGLNGPDIARQLVISPTTVHSHLSHIYEKLGVPNRAAAVARALRRGVID